MKCQDDKSVIVYFTQSRDPLIEYGLEILHDSLKECRLRPRLQLKMNDNIDLMISADTACKDIQCEGFKITKQNEQIILTGKGNAGIMYGCMELAEQVKLYGWKGIQATIQNPYMQMRGSKFNVPLDVRTPSYSDYSDVAQNNMIEMWDFDFWKEYLDTMAKYRYNFVSLWSLNPFPSMVKVSEYPDVALDDVHKSKGPFKEYYNLRGYESDIRELVNNYEVIKKLTIDEKIAHWRKVMAYGKSRNIDFYLVTWNIFVNGADGKYGITDKADNQVTVDYIKKSLKQMFRTYPDLAGVGLTTGENMSELSLEEKEEWAFKTYGKALLEVADEMPDRKFTLIHRQHFADPEYIAKKFKPLSDKENIEFIYSFKYAKAHVFSTTTQPYHEEFVKNIGDLKTIWTLRNDDSYYFRWGAPDFVREFIKNIPYDVSRGYYYGSDQWIWGREFTTRGGSARNRELEVVKHWYNWMMWGRLGYDPHLSNERFTKILNSRFPEIDGEKLFAAWQEASIIYPVTTAFHWGRVDFMWYIEGCRSNAHRSARNETGFHDVDLFINYPVHPKSGYQTIPDYVQMKMANEISDLMTPFDVSQKLYRHADQALNIVHSFKSVKNTELKRTIHDIKTIAYLGQYYAHKISGSTYVAFYRKTNNQLYQDKAVEELTHALASWKMYTKCALEQNINPIWTNRVGIVDWQKTTQWVEEDIQIARRELN